MDSAVRFLSMWHINVVPAQPQHRRMAAPPLVPPPQVPLPPPPPPLPLPHVPCWPIFAAESDAALPCALQTADVVGVQLQGACAHPSQASMPLSQIRVPLRWTHPSAEQAADEWFCRRGGAPDSTHRRAGATAGAPGGTYAMHWLYRCLAFVCMTLSRDRAG
jgi:hypothetical protein